jgi:hypothetical protein
MAATDRPISAIIASAEMSVPGMAAPPALCKPAILHRAFIGGPNYLSARLREGPGVGNPHQKRRTKVTESSKPWDGTIVRTWLESRIAAARADQVAAERAGYGHHDDCDKAAAEEMICTLAQAGAAADQQVSFADALKRLAERDEYTWRGVYDDTRFERHARAAIRKVAKMTKANAGFENTKRYQ